MEKTQLRKMKKLALVFVALFAAVIFLDQNSKSSQPPIEQATVINAEQAGDPDALLALAFDNEYSEDKSVDVDTLSGLDKLAHAYRNKLSNVQVRGEGTVVRLLEDDNEGSRHQRFIVRLANQQTVLIAHNIDLASRVNSLKKGDSIEFYGEYEWNDKGGVVHWTHKDPNNKHPHGYLKYVGLKYW